MKLDGGSFVDWFGPFWSGGRVSGYVQQLLGISAEVACDVG